MTTPDDLLDRLQRWFRSSCNGDWEHGNGVRITTIDNPGWRVRIDLEDTPLQGQSFARVEVERDPDDWFHCWVKGDVFNGAGGAINLKDILATFLTWAGA